MHVLLQINSTPHGPQVRCHLKSCRPIKIKLIKSFEWTEWLSSCPSITIRPTSNSAWSLKGVASFWHCNISYVCEMALTRCWTTWSTGYKIAFAQPQTLVSVADLCKSASELVLSGLVHLTIDWRVLIQHIPHLWQNVWHAS